MSLPARICLECLRELQGGEGWRCDCGALVCLACTEKHLDRCPGS